MNQDLADQLLARVLKWKPENISSERPRIELLAEIKYDEYQQFFPGMRFTESLASWLFQFDEEDRAPLYEFIRERLLFISTREMNQLIGLAFPDKIRPILLNKVAEQNDIDKFHIHRLVNSPHFETELRKTLFLGLSDGAHTDVIRRFNPIISHEQVLPFYLIPDKKIGELQEKLAKDLNQPGNKEIKFSNLVLLDDFTASGTSYFKKNDAGEYKGKVSKILRRLLEENDTLRGIFDVDNLSIVVIIYIATEKAKRAIELCIESWQKDMNTNLNFKFKPIYLLGDDISVTKEDEISSILSKYYLDHIETESYKQGRHQYPYLGFDECGLPLILSHNSPNNSLPILWNERDPVLNYGDHKIGLFPRVSRHKK